MYNIIKLIGRVLDCGIGTTVSTPQHRKHRALVVSPGVERIIDSSKVFDGIFSILIVGRPWIHPILSGPQHALEIV
jgi:hypothetical protein